MVKTMERRQNRRLIAGASADFEHNAALSTSRRSVIRATMYGREMVGQTRLVAADHRRRLHDVIRDEFVAYTVPMTSSTRRG